MGASQATTCSEAGANPHRSTQSGRFQAPRELICSGLDTVPAHQGDAVPSLYEGMAKPFRAEQPVHDPRSPALPAQSGSVRPEVLHGGPGDTAASRPACSTGEGAAGSQERSSRGFQPRPGSAPALGPRDDGRWNERAVRDGREP